MTTSDETWAETLAAAQGEAPVTQVVFIDSRTPDIADLIAGAQPGEKVFVLAPDQDGLDQIAADLAGSGLSGLSSISIVGHGASGQMLLGATTVDEADLASHAAALTTIGAALKAGGDLSLYGCDVAQGAAGREFIADLSSFVGGVDVAAATHLVGSAAEGGSFALDASTGAPVTAAPFTQAAMANYQGELATSPAQASLASDPFVFVLTASENRSSGASQVILQSVNDTGTYPETTPTTYTLPSPLANASFVQVDPQGGELFFGTNYDDVDDIYQEPLASVNTTTPTLIYSSTQTAGTISGLSLDPVNKLVLFDQGSLLKSVPYGNTTPGTAKTIANINSGSSAGDSTVGVALDTTNHNAYFFSQQGHQTYVTSKGKTSGVTGSSKNGTHLTTEATVHLHEATNYTSASPGVTSLAFQQLPAGSVRSVAVDATHTNLYFIVQAPTATASGIYKYSLSGNSAGAYTQILSLAAVGLTGTGADSEISNLTLEPNGQYYFIYGQDADQSGVINQLPVSGVYTGNVSIPNKITLVYSTPTGTGTSNTDIVQDAAVDLPPTLSATNADPTYTVGSSSPVAPINTASDSDLDGNGNLEGASVVISNAQTGDTLNFTAQNGISSSYSAGTLTLSGNATYAQYQTALDSVTFSTTSGSATTRSIAYSVNDGLVSSTAVSANVMIVVPPPAVGGGGNSVTYTEAGTAATVDSGVTVTDGVTVTGATVSIASGFFAGDTLNFSTQNGITSAYNSGTGVLTLSGSTSATNYQTALRSVSFSSTSQNPDDYGNDKSRTVTFQVHDASASSGTATSTVDITAVNNPPVLSGTDTKTFTQGAGGAIGAAVAVDDQLVVTDPDSQTLASVNVSINNGLVGDELKIGNATSGTTASGIGYSYDATSYVLSLTGSATLAAYQLALQSITFDSTSLNPTNDGANTSRTVGFVANDGVNSAEFDASVTIAPTDQPPVVTASGSTTTFNATGATSTPVVVDGGVAVTDPDNTTLASATVTITDFKTGDVLGFTNTGAAAEGNIAGSYSAGTLTLSSAGLSATPAQFQTALDSVTFTNATASPDTTQRTITFAASDGTQSATAPQTDRVTVAVPPPAVGGGGNSVPYTEAGTPATVDSGVTVSDPAGNNITGATIAIASGFFTGDTLNVGTPGALTGAYDGTTGVLTLSGSASAATYQTALRSVTFSNSGQNPDDYGMDPSRTVTFEVSDANASSTVGAASTSTVTINAVNNPAVLSGTDPKTFTQGANGATGTAVAVDDMLAVADPDNQTLASVNVSINNGLAGDELKIGNATSGTTASGIGYSYNATSYVLSLTGSATLAAYQLALQSITFDSTSLNPTNDGANTSRTVGFVANDGVNSAEFDATVAIAPTDQPPVVTASGGTTTFTATGATSTPVVVDGGISVTDPDNTTLASATVTITDFKTGDVLGFTNSGAAAEGNIAGSYNAGTLTLSSAGSSATLAQFQTALDSVTFTNATASPDTTQRTITFAASDGTQTATAPQTDRVTVSAVPTITSESGSPTNGDLKAGGVVTFTLGTSEPVTATGSTLTLSNGATAAYASGNGTTGSPLTYSYMVAQNDTNTTDLQATALNGPLTNGAGNTLDDTTFTSIDTHDTIDTTPPAAPAAPVLTDDNGASTSDNVTSDPAITYAMPAQGDLLLYSIDGTTYSTTVPSFTADGQYMVSTEEQDAAGNVGSASSLAFTLAPTSAGLTQALNVDQQAAAAPLFATAPTVSDVDPNATVTATLNLAAALGTLQGAGTAANGVYTFSGPAAAVTSALDAVTFTPTPGFNGSGSVAVALSDGAVQGDAGTVSVSVRPFIMGDVPSGTYIVDDNYTYIMPGPNGPNETELSRVSNAVAPGVGTLQLVEGSAAVSAVAVQGNHTLIGNQNDNVLVAQGGVDTLIGGSGNNLYVVDDARDPIIQAANGTDDTEFSSVSNAVAPNVGTMQLVEGSAAVSAVAVQGNHTLIGNQNDNVFVAQNGVDTLIGGSGNNIYSVDNYADPIIQAANGTDDIEYSSVSNTAAPNITDLHLVEGSSATVAIGNSGNNSLYANSNGDVLNGLGGNDTLYGGGGADTFQFSQTDFGNQTVVGFDPAHDSLSFAGFIYSDYSDLASHMTQSNADTIITYDANDHVIVKNTQMSSITAKNTSFFGSSSQA